MTSDQLRNGGSHGHCTDGTEHSDPVENIAFRDAEVEHVDYLLWSHGASNAFRARVTAEMRDERPPEWAVDAAGDLGQPKTPAECSRETESDRENREESA